MSIIETRVDELEMRLAHQERMIVELNDVITAQWKKIDMLERQLQRLGEELEAMEAVAAPGNQKPPHY
jgi:SlyX protein